MKIINEKGKLFGIINIIDLAVLLVVGLVLVVGAKRMKSKPIISSDTNKGIITMEVSDIRMVSVNNMVVGDPIYHYDKGTYMGKIVEVNHRPYEEAIEFEDKIVKAEVPGKYVAELKIESDVRNSEEAIIAGGEQIRVGGQFRIKNKKVTFFGTILGVEVE